MALILCTISHFRDIYSWSCHFLHHSQFDKFWREILPKIKPTARLLQFADGVLQTEWEKKACLELRIKENSMQKSSLYLQNWRSYGWICARIIFCRPHTWVRSVCGSKTSNCRNLLNIGPNELFFLWKDRQLNLQGKFIGLNFVYDQPFPRYF